MLGAEGGLGSRSVGTVPQGMVLVWVLSVGSPGSVSVPRVIFTIRLCNSLNLVTTYKIRNTKNHKQEFVDPN